MKKFMRPLAFSISGLSIAFLFTSSAVISLAFSGTIFIMNIISSRRTLNRKSWELLSVLPEIIDYVISGIQSGLSLNESLSNLRLRGPEVSRSIFFEFEESIKSGRSFEESIAFAQKQFGLRASDQLFEALLFARVLGGSELISLLRQLGDFTRQDLSLRKEISAKQSWIRNSAHLSSAAPWILLLLLSTQPNTADAFSSPAGLSILLFGVAMTALAYLWMGHLSRLPEPRRIFGS